MDSGEKPTSNKLIVAVALFFALGFVINLLISWNQATVLEKGTPTGAEILETVKGNSNKLDAMNKKLEENGMKLDQMANRLKVLEDNSKK